MLWLRVPLVLLLVAVLTALLIATGIDRGPGKPVATKYGVTSQGREFALRVDADGDPVAYDTELAALCPDGRMISMPWAPADGDGVVFERHGERLQLAEHGDGWRQELDAKVGDGGRLSGTMTLVVHITPKTRAAFDCRSPKVRFSAGR